MANFRIYNETLCPDLWDSAQHLDPEIRVNLLRMAYDFYEKTNLPAPIIDVYLMGSISNYNWTPDSDVDVHVIIDYGKLQMPKETGNKTVKTAGAQWNAEHNVLIKGHKVEMNLQNATEEKPYVTGIYSLVKDQWVRKPVKVMPQLDRGIIQTQYKSMKAYLENAMRTGDREQMKAAKKYLDAYRQYGLDTYGELSYENVIFKILRARGIIKALKDGITAVYDKEMSVDEVGSSDLKQRLPQSPLRYTDSGDVRLDRLTLDNLNALRAKAARMVKGTSGKDDPASKEINHYAMQDFIKFNAEIKKRLETINRPITENGVGSGIPEDDRLKIYNQDGSVRRWQIRSKDAPKTPQMTDTPPKAIERFDPPLKK